MMSTARPTSKSQRIAKTLNQKLRDLQYHSHQVRVCLQQLRQGHEHIKALAGELRVLLCLSSGTEGLLWRLIGHFRLDDTVCIYAPLQINSRSPLAQKLAFSFAPLIRTELWDKSTTPVNQSFRRVIKECAAVFIAGRSLTHEQLIKKVAEQTGSSHESDDVEAALLQLYEIAVNGSSLPLEILRSDAWFAVELCERVLEHAVRTHKFERTALSASDGDLSFAVALGYTELPSEPHRVFAARSDVLCLDVSGTVAPDGFHFVVSRPDSVIVEVLLPCAGPCDGKDLHIFVFSYSSRIRKCKWLTPHTSGLPMELNLGWMDPSSFSVSAAGRAIGSSISFRMTSLFAALLSNADIRNMCEAPANTFGLLEDSATAAARGGFP